MQNKEIFFSNLFRRDWLSLDEKDSCCTSFCITKDKLLSDMYIAELRLRDDYEHINLHFDIDSLQAKQDAVHKVRKLKQLITEFYNGLKSIPDNIFKEERDDQEV